MFDEHLNRQHRLSYFVRGPEWAFAVPQGDLAALEDVMRRCSGFWNGVGSLLVSVRSDGRLPRLLDVLLEVRGVDQCFMHEALSERARDAVQQRLPGAMPLWDRFDEHEIHPLDLLGPWPSADTAKPTLELPRFRSVAMQRMALAVWGYLPDEELAYWRDRYEVVAVDGEAAHGALVRGQVAGLSSSPLQLAAHGMGLVHQRAPFNWHPFVWVLDSASFDSIVMFWNFRARVLPHGHATPVLGVPRETLGHPAQLNGLADWTPRIPGLRRVPDAFVVCRQRVRDEVRAALATVPFEEETETDFREMSGRGIEPKATRTFSFRRPVLGGRFVRGTSANALVSFNNGNAALSLPPPAEFQVRGPERTRLVFRNLPLPLPVTASMARAININAVPGDGVLVVTSAMGDWDFDVRLPTAAEALRYWATDRGFTISYSQDGRDAESVLRRLGSLDALDIIADTRRLALLRAIAPASRKKLAQRLVAKAKEAGSELDEAAMVERLADIGLFLEVEARRAADIATAIGTGTRKRDVLRLLPPMVSAGFVRRAREVQCPQCRFRMLLDLADQDETVRCRACRDLFVLPVVDKTGQNEPELLYRLDGLMARAMDQDVLPVLLALRAVRSTADRSKLFHAWPGVESTDDGQRVDIDLLISDGEDVWCYEVKDNASGLKEPQLRKLIRATERLGARPGLAAVEGMFAPHLVKQVQDAGGRVLTKEQLLT